MVLNRCCEDVPAAADGLDEFRPTRVLFYLAPQPADLVVHAAVEGGRLAAAREIEKLVPAEHALRVLDEGDQELELAGGQVDAEALGRFQVSAREVDRPAGEAENGPSSGRSGRRLLCAP
jgi:hypothetical protein